MLFLDGGSLKVPGWLVCPGAQGRVDMPLAVAVLPRPGGRHLLVDCGFSAEELASPLGRLGALGLMLRASGRSDSPRRSIASQLAARGIPPGSVSHIVATHLHLDHIGGFVDFPHAEVLAAPAEIEALRTRGALRGYVHGRALQQSGRLVPVPLEPGVRHGFPNHRDLFGDGQVLLLDAAGHTPGSLAVLLTDGERSVLHAGDAAYSPVEYREGRQSWLSRVTAFRKDWLAATWGHLKAHEEAGGELVLAHDPVGLARVRHTDALSGR